MYRRQHQVCTPLDTRLQSAQNKRGFNLRTADAKKVARIVSKILGQGGNQCTEAMEVFISRDGHKTVKWNGEIVFRFVLEDKPKVSKDIAAWYTHLLGLAETVDLEARYA